MFFSVSSTKHLLSWFTSSLLCLGLRVDPILEDVQVVGGCNGDNILRRMPRHVQDFFCEVQTVNSYVSAPPLAACIHPTCPQHSSGLAAFPPCFQGHAAACLPVEHPEETVVRSCHDDTGEGTQDEEKNTTDNEKQG